MASKQEVNNEKVYVGGNMTTTNITTPGWVFIVVIVAIVAIVAMVIVALKSQNEDTIKSKQTIGIDKQDTSAEKNNNASSNIVCDTSQTHKDDTVKQNVDKSINKTKQYSVIAGDGIKCNVTTAIVGSKVSFSTEERPGFRLKYVTKNGKRINNTLKYIIMENCDVTLIAYYEIIEKKVDEAPNLPYIWNGHTYNGKPSGKGKMILLKHYCYLPKKKYYGNPGDVIEGYFDNGEPYNATHKDKTGTLIRHINELGK